ncbi:MAG: hypothetical protein WDO73_18480 [Ignavibacteriota bacterium]
MPPAPPTQILSICPKGIKLENIALMNRDFILANVAGRVSVEAG